jgi:2'-5' RNA ligase
MSRKFFYMFVLEPSTGIKIDVALLKREVYNLIGEFDSLHSTAHITVWDTGKLNRYIIDEFINKVTDKITNTPPAKIEIEGFDCFDYNNSSKTIYVAIKPSYSTDTWFTELYRILDKSERKPHITVCKGLNIKNFQLLWYVFKDRLYKNSFIPQCLTVLELDPLDDYPKWSTYKTINFCTNNFHETTF